MSADPNRNRNVEWLRTPFLLPLYVVFIALFFGVVHGTSLLSTGGSWAVTNAAHGLITFIVFHWWKGSPDEFSQGEFNGLTLWEQIDGGEAWTSTKKVLMLVPTIIVLLASMATSYETTFLALNLPVWVVLSLVPKIPAMHRVRIFGINRTVGIDDEKRE